MRAGDVARLAGWAAALALGARHCVGNWQLARTLAWLRRSGTTTAAGRPASRGTPTGGGPEVRVIIPVLREQQHVAAALEWWRQLLPAFARVSVMFVSTAREAYERDLLARAVASSRHLTSARFPQLSERELADLDRARAVGGHLDPETAARLLARTPLTGDVLDRLLTERAADRIRHLTYPGLGRKAAQVNYAARGLPGAGYLATYDVDSRPRPDELAGVLAALAAQPEGLGAPPVVQQHALHVAPRLVGPPVWRALVRGSALLQTVWTLRREIPYARRYQRAAARPGPAARLHAGVSQPVGHGLFLRGDVFACVGGLPEFTVLDDVPTGVLLTMAGIPTVSVPHLTAAPAPAFVGEVVAQHRRWFCSYLDYPAVVRAASGAGRKGSSVRRRLIAWHVLGVAGYRGAAWLAAGPLTAVTLLAALAPGSRPTLRLTACAGLLLATAVPAAMLARRPPAGLPTTGWLATARDSGTLIAAYVLRSVGPWLAVWDAARGWHPASATAPAPKAHRREGATQ